MVLTRVESETLLMIACGLSYAEIAQVRCVTPAVARMQGVWLMKKLGVESRTQAMLWALRAGLVSIVEAWSVVEQREWGLDGDDLGRMVLLLPGKQLRPLPGLAWAVVSQG